MQASETNNPLSCYSKASCRERFLHVLAHVCVVMHALSSGLHANPAVQIQIGDWLFSLHVVWGSGI